MAKPRIFICSTFLDLRHVREDIARFVKEQGFEDVLYERGHVPYCRKEAPAEYCYKEINQWEDSLIWHEVKKGFGQEINFSDEDLPF